jgi:tetratricopeptide (TPR) repeat protein
MTVESSGADRRVRVTVPAATLASVRCAYLLALCFGLVLSLSEARALHPNALTGGESPERFAEADEAFFDRAIPERALFALRVYRARLAEAPDDWEAAWRLAVATYHVGNRVLVDRDERERIWAEGRDAGQHAVDLQPECVPCNFWTAVNMALHGESVGAVRMLFSLSEIRSLLERVVELDPAYAYAGAPRTLAMIDAGLPRVLGGSDKRAERLYLQAIELAPGEPLNYEFYAAFLERKGHFDEALAIVGRGLETPPLTRERVESISAMETLLRMKPRLEAQIEEHGGKKKRSILWPFRR